MDNERIMSYCEDETEEEIEKVVEAMNRMVGEDPDPETVKMLEELESKKADPDALLLGAMEDVCGLISLTIAEAEEWGASTAQMIKINRSVDALAEKAIVMHSRLMAGRELEKLRLMRSVEQKNEERIKEWSEKQ